jgi:hypothetical protein
MAGGRLLCSPLTSCDTEKSVHEMYIYFDPKWRGSIRMFYCMHVRIALALGWGNHSSGHLVASWSLLMVHRKAIGVGLALGVVFGIAIHDIGLGLAIGAAFGIAIFLTSARKGRGHARGAKVYSTPQTSLQTRSC